MTSTSFQLGLRVHCCVYWNSMMMMMMVPYTNNEINSKVLWKCIYILLQVAVFSSFRTKKLTSCNQSFICYQPNGICYQSFNLMPVICTMLEYMVLFEFCALIVISENCFWYNFTESISVYKDILKYFPYKFSVDNPTVFFQEINRIWFSLYLKITLETTSQSEGVLH